MLNSLSDSCNIKRITNNVNTARGHCRAGQCLQPRAFPASSWGSFPGISPGQPTDILRTSLGHPEGFLGTFPEPFLATFPGKSWGIPWISKIRIRNNRIQKIKIRKSGIGKIGIEKIGTRKVGSGEVGSGKAGSGKVGSENLGLGRSRLGNLGWGKSGSGNSGPGIAGLGKFGIGKFGIRKFGFGKLGLRESGHAHKSHILVGFEDPQPIRELLWRLSLLLDPLEFLGADDEQGWGSIPGNSWEHGPGSGEKYPRFWGKNVQILGKNILNFGENIPDFGGKNHQILSKKILFVFFF